MIKFSWASSRHIAQISFIYGIVSLVMLLAAALIFLDGYKGLATVLVMAFGFAVLGIAAGVLALWRQAKEKEGRS